MSVNSQLYTGNYLDISYQALCSNAAAVRTLAKGRHIVAVLKSNAYGLGTVPVAQALERCGIASFAVGCLADGILLRRSGVAGAIVVLNGVRLTDLSKAIHYSITPVLHEFEEVLAFDRHAREHGADIAVHLDFETGLGRLGMPTELPTELTQRGLRVQVVGAMTHLACGYESGHPLTVKQLERFAYALRLLRARGFRPEYVHCASSAGLLSGSMSSDCNTVRAGRSLLGLVTDSETRKTQVDIRCAVSLVSEVVAIKNLPQGATVGYGGSVRLLRPTTVALLCAGYYLGLPRRLEYPAYVLIHNVACPVLGELSMELTAVDITDLAHPVQTGMPVVVLGRAAPVRVQDWANASGCIPVEMTCHFPSELPRVVLESTQHTSPTTRV
jgi:alanine racemase